MLRLAASLADRREAFHLGEHDLDRLGERRTHALVAADHREHADVLGRGQLHVDERDRLLRAQGREFLARGRMAVAAQRLERRVSHGALEAKRPRAVADPLAEDGLLAFGPVVVSAQVVLEVVRSVANDAGGDHAHHHGDPRSRSQPTASPEIGLSALPVSR